MITFKGVRDGKFQIEESDKGVLLHFEGEDADQFLQVNPPVGMFQIVKFSLTLKWLADNGFLQTADTAWTAVEHNDGGWSVVSLPRVKYDAVLHTVWERMMKASKENGGCLPEDFTAGEFDTQDEAAVAVTIANRAIEKLEAMAARVQ